MGLYVPFPNRQPSKTQIRQIEQLDQFSPLRLVTKEQHLVGYLRSIPGWNYYDEHHQDVHKARP